MGGGVLTPTTGVYYRVPLSRRSVRVGALLLIIVIFFVRGQWFGTEFGSVSYVLPAATVLLLSLFLGRQLWRNGAVALPPAPHVVLALAAALNLTVNAMVFPRHLGDIALFAAEIALNGMVLLVAYNLGRSGGGAIDEVLKLIQLAGILSGGILVVMLVSSGTFARLSFAATGVNHLGHALAILALISFYRALSAIREGRLRSSLASSGALIGALFLLFLSGTRSAMAGLLIALGVLLWLRGRRREVVLFYPPLLTTILILAVVVTQSEAFGGLVRRFDVQSLAIGLASRVDQWQEVLAVSTPWSVLFGAPWLYEAIADLPPVYPHNFLLSVGLYMGIGPLLLITWILATRLVHLYRYSRRVRGELLSVALLGALLIAVFYSSLSGTFTRVFTITFLLGLVEAWRSVVKAAPPDVGAREPVAEPAGAT